MNWHEMPYRNVRITVILLLAGVDFGYVAYKSATSGKFTLHIVCHSHTLVGRRRQFVRQCRRTLKRLLCWIDLWDNLPQNNHIRDIPDACQAPCHRCRRRLCFILSGVQLSGAFLLRSSLLVYVFHHLWVSSAPSRLLI